VTSSIMRLLRALLIGFAAVALALGYWQVLRAPQLVVRADNPRRVQAERQVQRGRLLDRNGAVLAYSLPRRDPDNKMVFQRHYAERAAAHLVGYYSLRYGTGGCEAVFDPILRGERTLLQALLHRPQRGADVTLSAHLAAMRVADAALEGHIGALVALDITNGEILAMVSHPSYDPNRLEAQWEDLVADPAAPLLNRATQGLYPVGDLARWVGLAGLLRPPARLHPHAPHCTARQRGTAAGLQQQGDRTRSGGHPAAYGAFCRGSSGRRSDARAHAGSA